MTALAPVADAEIEFLWQMQKEAFMPLLEKYRDYDTSPAAVTRDEVKRKRARPEMLGCWFILEDGEKVGSFYVKRSDPVREGVPRFFLSNVFVLPAYQNRGIAQRAIRLVEEKFPPGDWLLYTIEEEPGNCHLYAKVGYRKNDTRMTVNERMTLIGYEKSTL